MSNIIDGVLTYRILSMLVLPWNKTDAFHFGIIDDAGNYLKKPETEAEKESYSPLNRLVFNLKRLLDKVPGGKSKIGSLAAAYVLIKEHYEKEVYILDKQYAATMMESTDTLIEAELIVRQFLEDIAANNTAGVEVKNPDAVPKKKKKYTDLIKRI